MQEQGTDPDPSSVADPPRPPRGGMPGLLAGGLAVAVAAALAAFIVQEHARATGSLTTASSPALLTVYSFGILENGGAKLPLVRTSAEATAIVSALAAHDERAYGQTTQDAIWIAAGARTQLLGVGSGVSRIYVQGLPYQPGTRGKGLGGWVPSDWLKK